MRTAVIVATYEQPRWLDLALRAWARQELPASRVIVADDGSGPETAEVVRRWGAEHLRRQREADRFGKCTAVNAVVRHARELGCDFALFTDGDCLPGRG
ncbi:MAG TPA: glycosyltransferase, partial [Myxococcales bacterium]|nr:glycosyltransferase [Myxococcales bacterium]